MNKIEEVARAICREMYGWEVDDYEAVHKKPASLKAARAAIAAMREPTEAMMGAATELPITEAVKGIFTMAYVHGATLPLDEDAPLLQWYRAMIDAALEE